MSDPIGEDPPTSQGMYPMAVAMTDAMTDAAPTATLDPRVASAAAGDRAAAQALLTELLPRVRNLVRYLVRGDALVDDITQLVLIELLRGFGSFRHEGSLHAWVHRITVRVALRQAMQARKQRQQEAVIGADMLVTAGPAEAPDAYVQRRQAIVLLDSLPDDQRAALVLHHVVGMSLPELAKTLNIPFETARSRLRLAMTKLREHTPAPRQETP